VLIQGEGMGITNFVADATMSASPAIEVHNPAVGSSLTLLADAQKGEMSVTLSPSDAATWNACDYILLFSDKSVDTETSTKHAGAVKQVVALDATTGVVTVDDQIYDAYLVADSAALGATPCCRTSRWRIFRSPRNHHRSREPADSLLSDL